MRNDANAANTRGRREQPEEVAIDGRGVGGAESLVDDVLQRLRQCQHRGGGDAERNDGDEHPRAIRREEWQQRAQRSEGFGPRSFGGCGSGGLSVHET
jgi:hypothetical protein